MNSLPVEATLEPPGVVTTRSTGPLACGGVTQVICVGEVTVNVEQWAPPRVTDVTLVNSVPVMVSKVPPATEPTEGLTALTTGIGEYVKDVAATACPLKVLTTTLADPVPPGVVQVICVDVTAGDVQKAPPTVTSVAPATKSVPEIVSVVPPEAGPVLGLMDVTDGVDPYWAT